MDSVSSRFSPSRALAARLPFYYGWVIVAVMGIISFCSVAFTPALIGVFFTSMAEEFGWSRTLLSGAFLGGSVATLVMAPIAGRLMDRYGSRPVLASSTMLIAACLFGLALTSSPVAYYLLLGMGVAVVTGTVRIASAAGISQWFVRRRGAASGVMSVGLALGFATLPVLAERASTLWGWRAGWWAIGLTVLVLAVPASLLFLRRHPSDVGQRVDGEAADAPAPAGKQAGRTADTEVQWTAGEAVRTPTLWMLVLATNLGVLASSGISTHLFPYLEDAGMSSGYAALAVNIGGLTMIPAGLAWGWLLDHVSVRLLIAATGVGNLLLVGVLSLASDSAVWMVVPVGIVWGVGAASVGTVIRVAFPMYFGRKSAGTVLGIVTPFRVVAQGLGTLLAGIVYDVTGSYATALAIFAVLLVIGVVTALLVPPAVKRDQVVA